MGAVLGNVVIKFLSSSAGEAVLSQLVAEVFQWALGELQKANGAAKAA